MQHVAAFNYEDVKQRCDDYRGDGRSACGSCQAILQQAGERERETMKRDTLKAIAMVCDRRKKRFSRKLSSWPSNWLRNDCRRCCRPFLNCSMAFRRRGGSMKAEWERTGGISIAIAAK